jgi:hypothetical protein
MITSSILTKFKLLALTTLKKIIKKFIPKLVVHSLQQNIRLLKIERNLKIQRTLKNLKFQKKLGRLMKRKT